MYDWLEEALVIDEQHSKDLKRLNSTRNLNYTNSHKPTVSKIDTVFDITSIIKILLD